MSEALAQKYDRRVPRYTSYPTAPHFSPAVDGAAYRRWLTECDPALGLSVYLHIPFCDTLCWFCGCFTKVVNRYAPVRAYIDTLMREIDLVASLIPGQPLVRHLHWGGGSPSILHPDDWQRLVDAVGNRLTLAADAEICAEIDPRDADDHLVEALARIGVNRVSIGVQDFDPAVQAAINREQPFAVVADACRRLRDAGIDAINLDLMYGLPHQTAAGVAAMVERALSLAPARVALFGYAHVPWMRAHQRLIDEASLPDGVERWRQVAAATAVLEGSGYQPVGLDHFALPDDPLARAAFGGHLRRNFQGYTTDDSPILLGFGASSIGSLAAGFVQNTANVPDYARDVAAGVLPVSRGLRLSDDDRVRGEIIERLMCELTVDVAAIASHHGLTLADFAPSLDRLEPLIADGIAGIADGRITVTELGRPFLRLVAAAFDQYLEENGARHARAI